MKRGREKRRQYNSEDPWSKLGGYNNLKLQKLSELEYGSLQSNIFEGVSIYVNGYTEPNAVELHKLIKTNGGIFFTHYSKKLVTHIIASNLAMSKILKLTNNEKVVKAAWIIESVKMGKLLPIDEFVLLKKTNKQQLLLNKLLYKDESRDIDYSIDVNNIYSSKEKFISDVKIIDFDEDLFKINSFQFNFNLDDKNKYDYDNSKKNYNVNEKFDENIKYHDNKLNKTDFTNNINLINSNDNFEHITLNDNDNINLSCNASLSDGLFLDLNINNTNNISQIDVRPNVCDVFIPSQIDHKVFNELPFELQKEIWIQIDKNKLNEFENNLCFNKNLLINVLPINNTQLERNAILLQNKSLTKNKKNIILNKSLIKTKNKLVRKNKKYSITKRHINSMYNGDSFSQIDVNVFQNLPEEIRTEIKQQYGYKKFLNQKKFLISYMTNQGKFKNDLNFNDIEDYRQICMTCEVDLNGRIELDEIKLYIREWIESTVEPLEVDLQVLNEYFIKLLENSQLDFVYRISRYMMRLAIKEIEWAQLIFKIIENIQNNVFIVYGSPLKLLNI